MIATVQDAFHLRCYRSSLPAHHGSRRGEPRRDRAAPVHGIKRRNRLEKIWQLKKVDLAVESRVDACVATGSPRGNKFVIG